MTNHDEILNGLNDRQREALTTFVGDSHRLIRGHGQTLRALERKGLCSRIVAYRDMTIAELTLDGMALYTLLKTR